MLHGGGVSIGNPAVLHGSGRLLRHSLAGGGQAAELIFGQAGAGSGDQFLDLCYAGPAGDRGGDARLCRQPGEREGQAARALDIEQPLGTIVAGGQKHAQVAAFLSRSFGEQPGKWKGAGSADIEAPTPTITTQDHNNLAAVTLASFRGTAGQNAADSVDEPLRAVAAGGTASDPEAVLEAMKSDPDALLKIRQLEQDERESVRNWQTMTLQAELADVASARAAHKDHWMPSVLTVILGLMVVVLGYGLFASPIPAENKDMAVYIFGSIVTLFSSAVTYWIGTSRSSYNKDKLLGLPGQ